MEDINFWLFFSFCMFVGYPIYGACVYGDPWNWIYEDKE